MGRPGKPRAKPPCGGGTARPARGAPFPAGSEVVGGLDERAQQGRPDALVLADTRHRVLLRGLQVTPQQAGHPLGVALLDERQRPAASTAAGTSRELCSATPNGDRRTRSTATATIHTTSRVSAMNDRRSTSPPKRVSGRLSDLIIRGGKNISAAAVEEEVGTHPAVALAAAVAMPDEVFGERVCGYAELRPGAALTLDDLTAHLTERGVSREWHPERLIVLDALPRSSGGKVAKGDLRDDIHRRLTP